MAITIGITQKLTVDRKTDIGYMLTDQTEEVFLHFNESLYQELKPRDVVETFVYLDHKGRRAATLKTSLIDINAPEFLRVMSVEPKLGVFLDMGIAKDLLLSAEDLPVDKNAWPHVDDLVYVHLKIKGKMVAKMATRKDLLADGIISREVKDKVEAYIYGITSSGLQLITEKKEHLFVHESLIQGQYRIGQKVEVQITYISDKGINGSLIEQKETKRLDDAAMILHYLKSHGELPLDANSSPEAIKEFFSDMSKKAFKRALGNLYRQRQVIFVSGKTILVK